MTLIPVAFGGVAANLAAAAAPTTANLALSNLAAVTTVSQLQLPFPIEIRGIEVEGAPASGDTFTAAPFVGAGTGAGTGASALSAAITNAAPKQAVFVGPGQGITVPANTGLGAQYKTTTGATYTAKDTLVRLWIAIPDLL